jgi:hypothetical protein
MNARATEVLAQISELPDSERQAIADAIVLGPEETDPETWNAAWLSEVHRRRSAGLDDAIPLETFAARTRSRWAGA